MKESAALRTVRSPDALNKAAPSKAHMSIINKCKTNTFFKIYISWSLSASTNTEEHTLTEHPIHKAGCCFTFRPPAGWQWGVRSSNERRRSKCSDRILEIPKALLDTQASLFFFFTYIYVSDAVTASLEAVLLLWSAITHYNASCLGSAFEHALFTWLLKDTGCQHGAKPQSISPLPASKRSVSWTLRKKLVQ